MIEKKRISVVDDYPEILEMIAETLTDEGFEVQTIANHYSAYEEIRRWKPDLIMLDLMLGTAQAGWQVLDQLKRDPATQAVPVVLCSAATTDVREVATSPYARQVEYLEKPFEIDLLLRKIAHLLNIDGAADRKKG